MLLLVMQWAAVTSHSGEMSVAPQKWTAERLCHSDARQGCVPGSITDWSPTARTSAANANETRYRCTNAEAGAVYSRCRIM